MVVVVMVVVDTILLMLINIKRRELAKNYDTF